MQVTVELLGPLRDHLAGNDSTTSLDVPSGATVVSVIQALGIPASQSWNASIDGKLVYNETLMKDGDRMMVFPPIAGGC